MNRSGLSVGAACDYFRLQADALLIVCDDFNLPLGKLRFRARGSAGGQKGLADIIDRLGSDQFSRLRIGIGTVPEGWDAADFVLSKWSDQDKQLIRPAISTAATAVADWVHEGTEYCMNKYNAGP
jgi:PTH1 family peptidyl-tRNA hydrolase